jgi:hypothetical protein
MTHCGIHSYDSVGHTIPAHLAEDVVPGEARHGDELDVLPRRVPARLQKRFQLEDNTTHGRHLSATRRHNFSASQSKSLPISSSPSRTNIGDIVTGRTKSAQTGRRSRVLTLDTHSSKRAFSHCTVGSSILLITTTAAHKPPSAQALTPVPQAHCLDTLCHGIGVSGGVASQTSIPQRRLSPPPYMPLSPPTNPSYDGPQTAALRAVMYGTLPAHMTPSVVTRKACFHQATTPKVETSAKVSMKSLMVPYRQT